MEAFYYYSDDSSKVLFMNLFLCIKYDNHMLQLPHLFYRLSFMNMRITSIKAKLAWDEQESKLGEVDECIFASCFILLFCTVDVGS